MPVTDWQLSRRALLGGASAAALMPIRAQAASEPGLPATAKPLPLSQVRLLPSPYLDAVEGNLRYLHALDSDRLLHNFRTSAGLKPKGEVYGGWESDTIAGHTLGHYLTALALMVEQTGDAECRRRIDYIVDELATCQKAHRDGYVAGFTRKKDGEIEDGKKLFPEIMAGDIRSLGFDLNGCWVPLYNWHKLYSGLFEAADVGNTQAIPVAVALGGYIDNVFSKLSDAQVQQVLDCEHGGINESFAELYARTGDKRWLALAERIRHRKILDPLTAGQDILPYIHANTQIPKIIGLARLHELTGDPGNATAARFFWERVTGHYSYVIGGNADREYFQAPDSISKHITEQTCESCNTYNMLKLTRQLYSWQPQAALFDYYERAHINHILAQQDPKTGMFAYMVPLMSGTSRQFSEPYDDFWCCVGSGMESHSKHGESIWWQGGDTLIVNLYIPSRLDWRERKAALTLATDYPFGEQVAVTLDKLPKPQSFALALRIPAWANGATVSVNGEAQPAVQAGHYAIIRRRWAEGDKVALTLPMAVRAEPTKDDPTVIAMLRGPVVLAADLGPAGKEAYKGAAPALVAANVVAGLQPVDAQRGLYQTAGMARPAQLQFAPFYQQRDRRTAVYFRTFTEAGWKQEEVAFAAEQARLKDLEARSVDNIELGEMQPERDHKLEAENSYPVTYRGRHGRDARQEGYFAFKAKVRPGPLILQAAYWGEERSKTFDILVDGQKIATQTLDGGKPGDFFTVDYPIPESATRGKSEVLVRFQPSTVRDRCGPVFGVRIFTPAKDTNQRTVA